MHAFVNVYVNKCYVVGGNCIEIEWENFAELISISNKIFEPFILFYTNDLY